MPRSVGMGRDIDHLNVVALQQLVIILVDIGPRIEFVTPRLGGREVNVAERDDTIPGSPVGRQVVLGDPAAADQANRQVAADRVLWRVGKIGR